MDGRNILERNRHNIQNESLDKHRGYFPLYGLILYGHMHNVVI